MSTVLKPNADVSFPFIPRQLVRIIEAQSGGMMHNDLLIHSWQAKTK